MIILPERGLPKGKLLLPQRSAEWRQPSQRSSIYGPQNFNQWRLTARTDDGHIVWCGRFDDREDADAFLYSLISGSLYYEKDLWRLPNPWWPGFDPSLVYDFSGNRFIISTSAVNQSDSVPADWNNNSNYIDVIAAGGSGGIVLEPTPTMSATGGGGGAWSRQTNVSLTPGGSATFFLNTGGVGQNIFAVNKFAGNAGSDCWYNGATLAASSVGAKGGGGGNAGAPSLSGGAGGLASGGIGSTKYSGGNGGAATDVQCATGGGGAAGLNGDGVNGTAAAAGPSGTAGGAGDAGFGGVGGAGGTEANGDPGSNGTEYDISHGSGGGGGGSFRTSGATSGAAGFAGGASGGAVSTFLSTLVQGGAQSLIYLTYVPVFSSWDDAPQIPYRNLSKIKMVGY